MAGQQQVVEEKAPNPYNAKKSWHTPDKPSQGDAEIGRASCRERV